MLAPEVIQGEELEAAGPNDVFANIVFGGFVFAVLVIFVAGAVVIVIGPN